MQLEYKSGYYSVAQLRKMEEKDLISMYEKMREDGIGLGLSPNNHPPKPKFSSFEEAMLYCFKMHSSVVAAKESVMAITREESGLSSVEEHPRVTGSNPVVRATTKERAKKMTKVPLNAVITVLATENPKRRTAADRFALYKTGMVVQQYVELVGNQALAVGDVEWDTNHGWISWTVPQTESEEVAA